MSRQPLIENFKLYQKTRSIVSLVSASDSTHRQELCECHGTIRGLYFLLMTQVSLFLEWFLFVGNVDSGMYSYSYLYIVQLQLCIECYQSQMTQLMASCLLAMSQTPHREMCGHWTITNKHILMLCIEYA